MYLIQDPSANRLEIIQLRYQPTFLSALKICKHFI